MRTQETMPSFSVNEDSKVKMPLKIIAWLFAIVAAGAIAWGVTTKTVTDDSKRIDALETDSRSTREVLIRIDERTAEIKRRLDSGR